MLKRVSNILLIIIIVILDFLTKLLVRIFDVHYLIINYTVNSGVIFGFLKGHNFLFILISSIFVLIFSYRLLKSKKIEFGFIFILGGAVGNLIDRIIYLNVIDFIDLKYWYIFNLADMFIVIGVFLVLKDCFKDKK